MSVVGVLAVPSTAELIQLVRQKIMEDNRILWPTVSERIEALRRLKHENAKSAPFREHKTILDADICSVCLGGKVTDMHSLQNGWRLSIKGADVDGDELVVMVKLPKADADPLEIEDFVIPQVIAGCS